MSNLKYKRTVFYNIDTELWTAYYKNDKGQLKIDKTGRTLKDVVKPGSTVGHTSRLSKEKLQNDEYDYFVANKKDRTHDYIPELIKNHKHIKKILKKELSKLSDNEKDFLERSLDFEHTAAYKEEIIKKLKIKKTAHEAQTEFLIQKVMVVKYSKYYLRIPKSIKNDLQDTLYRNFKNKKIQAEFFIDNESFFTPYFIPRKNMDYEKFFESVISQYPLKIKWVVRDIKIRVF